MRFRQRFRFRWQVGKARESLAAKANVKYLQVFKAVKRVFDFDAALANLLVEIFEVIVKLAFERADNLFDP